MNINIEQIKQGAVRFIAVAGLIIGVAYLVYHEYVFIRTTWPFQFFISGITIGLSYAVFYTNKIKEGIAILVLLFIVSSGFIAEHRAWNYVLQGTYISIMSCAVYLELFIRRKQYFTNRIMCIVIAGVVIGVSNSLIIVVLGLFSPLSSFAHFPIMLKALYLNLKIGTVMGLLFGIGSELSTYIISSFLVQKEAAN
jgi:hypothetical protein